MRTVPFYCLAGCLVLNAVATGGLWQESSAISISNYASKYEAWPSIGYSARSRSLYVVYRTSDSDTHGFDPTGKVMLRKSVDGGVTWTDSQVIADEPGIDDRNPAIMVCNDGNSNNDFMLVAYNTYDSTDSRCFVTRSFDGGRSWGLRIPVSDGKERRTRGKPILLSTGRILLPLYDVKTGSTYVAESSDWGASWKEFCLTNKHGDETSLLELRGGSGEYGGEVLAVIRDNRKVYWVSRSFDYGRTWSDPIVEIALPVLRGTPLELLRLGRFILAFYTLGDELVIYKSSDEGRTWMKAYVVVVGASESYYPSATLIGD